MDSLGPLPTLHPREKNVRDAETDIRLAIHEAIKKHDLTTGEILRVVTACLSDEIGSIAKFAIRRERHRSTKKPGGVG